MNNRQEIELAIRASLGSSRKTLAELSKGIDQVSKNIEAQSAAATRGENSIDELTSSMASLKAAQDQLKGRDSLVSEFTRQGKALADAQAKVEKTAKAYADYKAKLDASGKATEKQNELLLKKAKSHEAAQAALARQQAQEAALRQTLVDAGIATENLAAAQLELRTVAAQVGVAMNKAQVAIDGYGATVRKARADSKAAADEAAANSKKQSDAAAKTAAQQKKLFEQSERFAANIAAAQDAFSRDNALIKQGQQAEEAARKYQTLARAATDLRPKIVSLRDALSLINDPGKAKVSNFGGIESEIAAVAGAVGKIRGPVKDYEVSLKSIANVQKALSGQAGLVDQFRQQVTAVRQARAEFVQARAQVITLAAAVKQGGEAGQQFAGQLAQAESRLKQTATTLRDVTVAARDTQTQLREAGVATNNLAGAEEKLQNAAKGTIKNLQDLTAAVDRYGVAKQRANKSGTLFGGDDGRTTLSFLQRIRGELLALATTYTGLQGSINLAKGAIDAFNTREGAKNQLGIALDNDRARIDAEYTYVRQQSDRIGIEFEGALKQFAKFSTAASLAGRGRQEIKFIFETFAELGRVANLSTADLDGVFKALEQIFSKGKIQAEELRGQLGDRLFGAFQVAAASLKKEFPDLDKALKDGVVTSEQLVKIAEQYKKIIAGQLPAAQQSLAAEQMRLNNAFFDFKTIIADRGFADSFKNLVIELNKFLSSGEGAKLADNLATAFTRIGQALVFVIKNMQALVTASVAFFALWTVGRVGSMATSLAALGGAAGVAATKIASVAGAVGVVQAAIAGLAVGSLLNELFPNLATNLQAGVQIIIASVRTSFGTFFALLPDIAARGFLKILDIAVFIGSQMVGVFAGLARKLGLDGLANTLTDGMEAAARAIQIASAGTLSNMANTIAAGRKELTAELDRINDLAGGGISTKNVGKTGAVKPTDKPPAGPPGPAKLSEEELNKRASAIQKMEEALNAIDARIDKADKDLLAPQLAAVDKELLRIKNDIADIAKFNKGRAAGFTTQLAELEFGLRQQTLRKFNDGVLQEQEALNRDLEALDAAAGRKDKESLRGRLDAIEQTYASTFRKIEELRSKALANAPRTKDPADQLAANAQAVEPADQMAERARLAVEELKRLEIKKINLEALKRQEATLNDLLTERAARLKTVDEQEAASILTREQAEQRRKVVLDEMQVKIVSLAEGARLFVEAMGGQIDQSSLDEFTAKVGLAVVSAERLNNKFTITRGQLEDMATTGLVGVFDDVIKNISEAVAGTKSWGQAIKGVARSFLSFAADFLRQIALMIAKQLILKSIQAAFPGFGNVGEIVTAGVTHAGGVVGSTQTRKRAVHPGIFANAPRYHNGKLVGLANNEVPAILERQEEVLSKNDPRNALNGGLSAGGGGASRGTRFVLVDDRSKIPEAMATSEGENVILEVIRRNATTVKQYTR